MKSSNLFLLGFIFLCQAAFFSCGDGSDSSGSRSAPGAEAVAAKERADAVGDIIFSDGTAVPYGEGLVLSEGQKATAVAVVFYKDGSEGALGGRMLAVGVRHDKAGLPWCDPSAKAYARNLYGIVCTARREEDGSYSFVGDVDGSDNIDALGLDDTYIEWRYPAFYFAINYADSLPRIRGTACEDGWYLPSVAELYQIWRNREIVDAALRAAGGDAFDVDNYWSSSVDGVNESAASRLLFAYGSSDSSCKKYRERCVCAIREF